MATGSHASPPQSFTATARLAAEAADDGRVDIAFTARGGPRPGIWSPAFGGPRPRPMLPDGAGNWRLEVRLPADASASWAAVPDLAAVLPSTGGRLRALVSARARARLGTRMDSGFRNPEPVAPSLYRLIGADPRQPLAPNVGRIPTPDGAGPDGRALCAAAPTGDERDLNGHRLVRLPGDGSEVLFLDGEVLRRCDAELADTGWSRSYLDNRGAVERMRDGARPLAVAERLAPLLSAADCAPRLIVGTSALAPTALALALRLAARRVLLLSPAFLDRRVRARLLARAAATDIHVEVRAGSLENGGGDPRRCLNRASRALVTELRDAGGSAEFTEFSGGHDLPAWHVTLLDALRRFAAAA